MFSNSSIVLSRPKVESVICVCCPSIEGCWPIAPVATGLFCSRTAAATSLDVRLRDRQLMRIEPNAHAVIALAEQKDVADAVDARQLVLHLQDGVIAEVELVVAARRRRERDAAQNVGRTFDCGDARLLDDVGQRRDRQAHPVLHEHLRHVEVDAVLERDHQVVRAVVGALRVHVHHALDAVDLLLDGCRDGLRHVLGARARVVAGDLHGGRSDGRELRQAQIKDGDSPRERDDDRQHRGKNRPIDKEPRNHACLDV